MVSALHSSKSWVRMTLNKGGYMYTNLQCPTGSDITSYCICLMAVYCGGSSPHETVVDTVDTVYLKNI